MLSRVADHLYWMSRYLERAEHMARVLDVNLQRTLEQTPEQAVRRWDRVIRGLRITAKKIQTRDTLSVTLSLGFDQGSPESIVSTIAAARENARQVRQQLSTEMWEQINKLYLRVRSGEVNTAVRSEARSFFHEVKLGCHLFEGITNSTMSHGEGWDFLMAGRFIERAQSVAALLDSHLYDLMPTGDQAPDVGDYYEWICLLKSCTAFEAYCREYTADVKPARVAEFLLLNAEFPHSVHFAAAQLESSMQAVAERNPRRDASRVIRLSGRLRSMLGFGHIDEILGAGIHPYLGEVHGLCSQIQTAVTQAFISYPIETALAG